MYKLQETADARLQIVRVGDPERPAPYTMKLFEYDDEEPPEPLALPKKVQTVLVLCDAHSGIPATQRYCREIRQRFPKVELVVRLTSPPKNPDRGVMLANVLGRSGAHRVSICGVMFGEDAGPGGQVSPLALTIHSAEGSVSLDGYGGRGQ
eukprot:CAMPEP_0171073388 /NCGR_PEP_ID=MMETSP0766_2-20121228/11480_1 /TAXON_ID=439317 /ORGANISM="Gambierdiscus australes, Strain CAWD 149" /LENGTH=150 /DNA_ID=CAMNT_0011530073 /DNA_START=89 /DNA_END=541 /DNA_ORIENTATION=-